MSLGSAAILQRVQMVPHISTASLSCSSGAPTGMEESTGISPISTGDQFQGLPWRRKPRVRVGISPNAPAEHHPEERSWLLPVNAPLSFFKHSGCPRSTWTHPCYKLTASCKTKCANKLTLQSTFCPFHLVYNLTQIVYNLTQIILLY